MQDDPSKTSKSSGMNLAALVATALAAGLAMWISTSVYNARLKRVNQELENTRRALNEKSLQLGQLQLQLRATTRSSTQPTGDK